MTAPVASLCVVLHAGVVFANRLRIDHPDAGTQLDEPGFDRVHWYLDSARIRPDA